MSRVVLSAGDASGDLHAAEVVRALRARRPGVRIAGLGGEALARAGMDLAVHQREIAVGGLVEVLPALRRVRSAWRRLGSLLEDGADLLVLVDSPELNLPLAARARRAGVHVLYYICPQVWAWRRGRIRKIARRVDRLAAIFPFEREVFRGTGLQVEFVGHPLVDPLAELRRRLDRGGARKELGLDPERPLVLLLPGSRHNEVHYGLPLHLETVRRLHARDPRLAFALAVAPTIDAGSVEAAVAAARLPSLLRLDLVRGRAREAILASDVVLAKPGTSTLEIALLGRPMVVTGRGHPASVALMRRLIRVPHLAMPNLIAGREVVPELLQESAEPGALADAVAGLVEGPARARQLDALREVRERMGEGGAAERVARMADEMLGGRG